MQKPSLFDLRLSLDAALSARLSLLPSADHSRDCCEQAKAAQNPNVVDGPEAKSLAVDMLS